jgi:hypothetical protein
LQLEFLGHVWDDLDKEHQDIQKEILTILNTKIATSISKIDSVTQQPLRTSNVTEKTLPQGSRIKRLKYALFLKEYLDKAIVDMESWRKLFDPSWYLIMRVSGQHVDKELSRPIKEDKSMKSASGIRDLLKENPQQTISVFLPENGLDSATFLDMPFSSAKLVQRAHSKSWLILDSVSCDFLQNIDQRKKAVRDLATKLTRADPSKFALLKCAGVVAEKGLDNFQLVFNTPEHMSNAQTLRASLLSGNDHHSLSDRFRLATQLATAVCSVHTFGLVHKSIQPENIVVFQDQDSALGSAFLIGFDKVRPEEGRTRLTSDVAWEKNLYRHPQRQGFKLQDPFVMQHDIYSLGVCMLEIGLWKTFVQYSSLTSGPIPSQDYNFGAEKPDTASYPDFVKERLLSLARDLLPRHMGSKYANIVQTCLTCLDKGNEDFGDESEFQDRDGVLIAVRYIEKVSCPVSFREK